MRASCPSSTEPPGTSHRLTEVVDVLDRRWPGTGVARLVGDYDRFRQGGAGDLDQAESLARATPGAIRELQNLVESAATAMTEPLNQADRLAAIERRFAAIDRRRDDSDARLDEIRAQLLADLRVRPTAALWGSPSAPSSWSS